jgi:hypothetical protein
MANDDTSSIQAEILQTTLSEISSDDHDNAPLCCVICLDSVTDACVAEPCTHKNFDFVCLANWLQQQPTCPLCKASVTSVRYGFCNDTNTPADEAGKGYSVYRVPQKPAEKKLDTASNPAATLTSRHSALDERPWNPRRRRYDNARTFQPPPTPDEAILRRRHVYRHQLYSLHIGSNRHSKYRDPTPAELAAAPHLISRAKTWLRRELQVFEFLRYEDTDGGAHQQQQRNAPAESSTVSETRRQRRVNNAEFLLEYIVAILKTVDIQGSAGQALAMLADFLGREHARLFLHELRSWLRSPHASLVAWDREVQYPEPEAGAGAGAQNPKKRSGTAHPREEPVGDDNEHTGHSYSTERLERSRPRGDFWRPSPRGKRQRRDSTADAGESRPRVRGRDEGRHRESDRERHGRSERGKERETHTDRERVTYTERGRREELEQERTRAVGEGDRQKERERRREREEARMT